MAITSTERTQIVKATVAMFGAAPGGYMTELTNLFVANGNNITNFMKALATTTAFTNQAAYSNFKTVEEKATSMAAAYGLTDITTAGSAGKQAYDYFVAQLTANVSIGEVFAAANSFLASTTDTAFATTKTLLTNKTAVAEYYTVDLASSSTTLSTLQATISSVTATTDVSTSTAKAAVINSSAASTTGSTYTLSTAIDTLTGTSGNDTFIGVEANIGALDTITGGAGTDTLSLAMTSAAYTLTAAQVSGVETLSINQGTADQTGFVVGATGITTLTNNASTKDMIVTGLDSVGSVNVNSVTVATTDTTVSYLETAVTGSADTVTLTVNGTTNANIINLNTATATATVAGAIETVNLVSAGSVANSIVLATNDTAGMGTLNISGAAALTVDMSTNVTTDVITINAASATGNVTVTGIGAGNTFAGVATGHTITGGSGNDTFVLGANYVGAEATLAGGTRDTINGGAGTDTVSMTFARVDAADTTAQENLTSIEGLTISDAVTGALDFTKFTGVTGVTLTGATLTGALTVNSGTTVTLAADTGNGGVTFSVGGIATTDTMTLNMAGFDFDGATADAFSGIETLNINTGSTITNAATFANTLTMTPSAGGTTGIVVTGNNAMTFTGVVTAGTIDASALTGVLTVTGVPANAITIKGGTAGDTITGSASADSITAGNGADTITSGAGADSIILTETTAAQDTIVSTIGGAYTTAAADVITGFTAGATGDILQIDISDSTAIASLGIVTKGDGATAIAGDLVIKTVAKGAGATTLAATDEILVITGTYADSSALLTDMGSVAGTTAISWSAAPTTTNGLLVVWSDGTNTHVSAVSDVDAGTSASMQSADLALTDLVVLTGVLTGFNTVNFTAVA